MNFLTKLFSCQDHSQTPLPILRHKTVSENTSSEQFITEMWIRKTDNIHSKFDYKLIKLLGQGASGKVYLAEAQNPDNKSIIGKVALKILSKSRLEQQRNYKKYLILEKRVHSEVKASFLIKFIQSFQSKSSCFIALQYASGGSVVSLLHSKRRKIIEKNLENCIRFIVACVIMGLKSLHQSKFAYRDLKPENLLITQNGYVKIADFGLAEQIQDGQTIRGCKCGTLPYLAPEMALKQQHNKLVDLWGVGILIFQLFTKKTPFSEMEINSQLFKQIAQNAAKNNRFIDPLLPDAASDLISKLLKVKIKDRLGACGFQDIMNHQFFQGFNWQALSRFQMKSPLLDSLAQRPIIIKSQPCSEIGIQENKLSYKNVSQFTTQGSPIRKKLF